MRWLAAGVLPGSSLHARPGATVERDLERVNEHDMNSVMEIGDNIMFLYKGEKLWEGNNDNITQSDVKELNNFVFANKMMRKLKGI